MARRIGSCGRHAKATTAVVVSTVVAACASAVPGRPGLGDASTASAEAGGGPPARAFYTAEQAERGERLFSTVCSACHGGSEFRGPIFALTWMAEPVGHLFEHVSTTMPQDRPGSLSSGEYASILAYFLRVNGREAGELELPANAEILNTLRW